MSARWRVEACAPDDDGRWISWWAHPIEGAWVSGQEFPTWRDAYDYARTMAVAP